MNAIEIEQAVSELFSQPYDAAEFPYQFLEAFGNKATTLKRLRAGETNQSDCDGVLQRSHIHILTCAPGQTTTALATLQQSPTNAKNRVNYLLATDGIQINATDLQSGEPLVCDYADFPNHFGFFLGLAGIRTVKAIRDSAFDIRATAKLNRLYTALLKDNPDWANADRRHDMNHFMARLIFCFFAEDTDIFNGDNLFSATLEQMSAVDGSDLEYVIGEIFRAMNTNIKDRQHAKLRSWADTFPYVNGGLFSDAPVVPRFTRTTRAYLLQIGLLDWTKINPDIFGSMIQAVADEEERGELGMHYTSVPNILKVLNPLFLDALRTKLEEAGDNKIKLLNLRKRIARIRVFDPACGSGNFLVIAYKELRHIENQINQRRDEAQRKSDIPLTNFRGIEIRDFSAEIARLALVIAEYQANVQYLGQMEALAEFLPLSSQNWITCGNALRLNWLAICPPNGSTVKHTADDLFATPLEQSEIDFENEGGETYICGNPPYLGSTWQSAEQKADLQTTFAHRCKHWKSLDYVAGWFIKAADYMQQEENSAAAFVSTNSICQGQQVPILWPLLFASSLHITFAHTSFKWANLASHNAGVTVAIIGISRRNGSPRRLYSHDEQGKPIVKEAANINAYLVPGANIIIEKASSPISEQAEMKFGNKPVDGGNLLMSRSDMQALQLTAAEQTRYIRRIYGSAEYIRGLSRYCLWLDDTDLPQAMQNPAIACRIAAVRAMRLASTDKGANEMAKRAHQMREMNIGRIWTITAPRTSSENRPYLPTGLLNSMATVTSEVFALYDAPLWNMALIASRLHLVWIATVCGKLKTDFRYSNTLGWNTFPVPPLTEQHKADLTESAAAILLAREKSRTDVATTAGMYLRRRIKHDGTPECVPLLPHERSSRASHFGLADASAQPVAGATLADFDPLERERLRQSVQRYGGDRVLLELSDEDMDGALGFTTRNEAGERVPTLAGLLIIGRETALREKVPTHEFAFQVLSREAVGFNEFHRFPLLKAMEWLETNFRPYNPEDEMLIDMFRVPIPKVDMGAFREALANALIHRDYHNLRAVYVRLNDDELTISNPGGLVEGVTLQNLLTTEPRPRNPALADAMKRIGIVERSGRGVDKIYRGLLRFGRPEPDYRRSDEHQVVVQLATLPADKAFLQLVVTQEKDGQEMPVNSLIALATLYEHKRMDSDSLAEKIQRDHQTAHTVLERLVEAGLVEAHGNTRNRSYTLSALVYRAEGQAVAYTRQAGFNELQQEQMVLAHISHHGSIRRAEVMALCRLADKQATRLLKKLETEGKIQANGQRRWTFYTLPE